MKILLTMILFLSVNSVSAQNYIDLINVYWRASPGNNSPLLNDTRNLNTFIIDAKLPLVIDDNNVVIIGLEHQHNIINFSNEVGPSPFDYKFGSSTLQLGLEHKWNTESKLLLLAIPRLNTDYKNITVDHFQLGGLALGTKSRSEKFDWKYGLYYNGEFFGPMFVPLFGFNWEINDKWRFKTIIPINLELSFHPNSWFQTGLRFDGVNGSYQFSPLLSTGDMHIDKADNNAWAFAEFNIGSNIWFHVKAGHSVLRKYRIYENNEKLALKLGPVNIGDDRPASLNLIENGWSFEFRFIYRLPLD